MTKLPLTLLAAAVLVGCGPTRVPDPTISANTRKTGILSADEILNSHADITNAYDAIARLRPNWLAPHGITSGANNGAGTEYAQVYLDGQLYGDLNTLRGIPAFHIGSARYFDVTQAGARFGIRAGSGGVIEVTTKTPGKS